MSFSQFLLMLKARYKIVFFTLTLVVAIVVAISLFLPKSYKASTTVLINYKGADPVTGLALPAQLMPGYMATQSDLIMSKKVARKVIADLGLANSDSVKQSFQEDTNGEGDINDWLSELLLKRLDIKPSRESSVIEISFNGANPQFAALIANAFAEAYIQTTIALKVEPSQKAAEYFTKQIASVKDNLTAAQLNLSEYQQSKEIISIDERMDVERARLSDLSSQLVLAQAQMLEARSRQQNSHGAGAIDSPDVAASPIVMNLKTDIARAESKFADISQKYEKNHPAYQGAEAELINLKRELQIQILSASTNLANNSKILQQREGEIRAALNMQKQKILDLNKDRDALLVLTKEVENAQHAYDLITQRFVQTNIEGQSDQSEVAILNSAVAPLEPASPNLLLNTVVAFFLGLLLGIIAALLTELANRKVRSVEDVYDIFDAPILGEVVILGGVSNRKRLLANKPKTTNLLSGMSS